MEPLAARTVVLGPLPMFVQQLWRYPIKSMRGERCETLELEPRGVVADRVFAIRTRDGQFGSGKTTRRFRRIDGLIEFQAVLAGTALQVHFPGGQCLLDDDPEIHAKLSAVLGQPVTLEREEAISHLDAGPVHLLTTASLAWLRKALPDAVLDPQRFRPNVVIQAAGEVPVEQDWLGRSLRVGEEVLLRISKPCDRCRMVSFAQADLPSDAGILRHIARQAAGSFGVYADVLVPGRVKTGDVIAFAASG